MRLPGMPPKTCVMSGKPSRSKGRRGEYLLRDILRALGWEANRVPLSGASQGYKGDVAAKDKQGNPYVFEVKTRRCNYKSIYTYLLESGGTKVGLILSDGMLCEFTTDLNCILDTHNQLFVSFGDKRLNTKLRNMQKLLKGAHILAVKDDHKPFIYLRYYA